MNSRVTFRENEKRKIMLSSPLLFLPIARYAKDMKHSTASFSFILKLPWKFENKTTEIT